MHKKYVNDIVDSLSAIFVFFFSMMMFFKFY